jgi:tetratricopeptide (TPR) repeat protein
LIKLLTWLVGLALVGVLVFMAVVTRPALVASEGHDQGAAAVSATPPSDAVPTPAEQQRSTESPGESVRSAARVDELNNQAKAALEGGRPGEAVLFLESAQALSPDDQVLIRNLAFAHYKVAELFMEAHDTAAAGAAFRRAWGLDSSQAAYGLHAVSLSLRAFQLEAALTQVDEILALHPESSSGHLLRGDILNLLDRLDESLAAYELAVVRADEVEGGNAAVKTAAVLGRDRTKRQLEVERDYISEETAYFVVRHPPASDHLRLVGVLERARIEVCHALGDFPTHKALVVLYPPEAFRAVTGTHDWVGGLFDRKIRLPIADLDQGGEQVETAFRHEFSHLMVSQWNPRCPTFVNEGLAQVMEYGRGLGLDRLVDYLDGRGLGRESLPRIAELPESFVAITDRNAVGLNYMLSYAFVDHVAERHGMGVVVRWIRALEQGSLESTYHETTGRTLAHEEELFRELVRTAR